MTTIRTVFGGLFGTAGHESRVKKVAEQAFASDVPEQEVDSVRIHRRGPLAYAVVIRAAEEVPPARIPPDSWSAYWVSRFTLATRRIDEPYQVLSGPIQLP